MTSIAPAEIVPVANILGEGILWDPHRGCLWWTDIHRHRLYSYDWSRASLQFVETPERISSFGLISGSEDLITAFASGIAVYHPAHQTIEWLFQPEELKAGVRFNDGRVDRRGRFWSGTMVEAEGLGAGACLYSISRARARCQLRDLSIANGLCMSPDGSRLYFTDSPTRTILVYELIEPDGVLGAKQAFARTPAGAYPDGAAVDADGCVWSAHWGGGCIVRYTPEGRIDRTIDVPTQQPTCVCFAGPALDVLCVTSAREGLDNGVLCAEPHAGHVFFYHPGVQGLPESEYLR